MPVLGYWALCPGVDMLKPGFQGRVSKLSSTGVQMRNHIFGWVTWKGDTIAWDTKLQGTLDYRQGHSIARMTFGIPLSFSISGPSSIKRIVVDLHHFSKPNAVIKDIQASEFTKHEQRWPTTVPPQSPSVSKINLGNDCIDPSVPVHKMSPNCKHIDAIKREASHQNSKLAGYSLGVSSLFQSL